MKTSKLGIDLIKHFESLHDGDLSKIGLQPKLCPANIVTIGYGHAVLDKNGNFLKGKDGIIQLVKLYPNLENITEKDAENLLMTDLISFENNINSLKLKLLQHEFDALVSFSYNLGFGALSKSTLLKKIINKEPEIKDSFLMWVKAGGKVLSGLVKRREAEATLFLTGKLII